jgi:hypothetical protein
VFGIGTHAFDTCVAHWEVPTKLIGRVLSDREVSAILDRLPARAALRY